MKLTRKYFKKSTKKLSKQIAKHARKLRRSKHRKRYALISLIVFIGAVASIYVYFTQTVKSDASGSRLVTFHDRGQDHVILTKAGTVRDALMAAHISVDAQDDVEPAIDSTLNSSDSAVIIYRARPVLVVDGALKEKVFTPAQSPNEIALAAGLTTVGDQDKTSIINGTDLVKDGASTTLTIERAAPPPPTRPIFAPTAQALSRSKGAQLYTDSSGVVHRETYYDLPMNIVISACGPGDYTIRYDGAKIDKDGYILVAANYGAYPRCSVVETSMGPGKVYDTGGFATRYPHGFDLATDWTNYNGR